MRFSSTFIAALFYIIGSSIYVIGQREQVPRVIFSGPGNCTATEHAMIDKIFEVPARRSLLRAHSISSRELNNYPSFCIKLCAGQVRFRCRSSINSSCNGYRLLQETSCAVQLNMFQNKLDTLRHNVSESCHSFIGGRTSRTAECLDKISYGEIHGARLWRWSHLNSTFQIVQDRLPAFGYPICRSHHIAIEAVNDPCVKEARMQLFGPNNTLFGDRTETKIPYTVFGDMNGKFNSRQLLNVGKYTLRITPDNDTGRTRQWMFDVTNC